jgi:hypothetical protein
MSNDNRPTALGNAIEWLMILVMAAIVISSIVERCS